MRVYESIDGQIWIDGMRLRVELEGENVEREYRFRDLVVYTVEHHTSGWRVADMGREVNIGEAKFIYVVGEVEFIMDGRYLVKDGGIVYGV